MKKTTFLQLTQLSFTFILPLVCLASDGQHALGFNAIPQTATTYEPNINSSTVIQGNGSALYDPGFAYNIFYLQCVDDKNKIYQIKELKKKSSEQFRLDSNISVIEEHLYQALKTLFNQIAISYEEIYHQDNSEPSEKNKLDEFNKKCLKSFKVQKSLLIDNEPDQQTVFVVHNLNFTIENRQEKKQAAKLQDMGIHISLSRDKEKVPHFFFCLQEPIEVQIQNKEEIDFNLLSDEYQKDFLRQVALGKSFFTVCNENKNKSKNKKNKMNEMKDLEKKLKIRASGDLAQARLKTLKEFKGQDTKDYTLVFKYKVNTIEEKFYKKNEKAGYNSAIELVSPNNKDSNDKPKSLSLRLGNLENELSQIIEVDGTEDDLSDGFEFISTETEVITRTEDGHCLFSDDERDGIQKQGVLKNKNKKSKKRVTFEQDDKFIPTEEIKHLKGSKENTTDKNNNLSDTILPVVFIFILIIVVGKIWSYAKSTSESRKKPTDQNKKSKGVEIQKRALSSR